MLLQEGHSYTNYFRKAQLKEDSVILKQLKFGKVNEQEVFLLGDVDVRAQNVDRRCYHGSCRDKQ